MLDLFALVLAVVLVVIASSSKWQIKVGKHRSALASGAYKLGLIFPLGGTISILAILRLIGRLEPDLCRGCSRITYGLVATPLIGWVLTFIGLIGLKSFGTIDRSLSKALVLIGVICGPLLLGVGFFEILVTLRG